MPDKKRPDSNGILRENVLRGSAIRSCVGCGKKSAPETLLRVASFKGAAPVVDEARARHKAPGRGAYLCAQKSCLERAIGRRAFERALKLNCGFSSASKDEIARIIETPDIN